MLLPAAPPGGVLLGGGTLGAGPRSYACGRELRTPNPFGACAGISYNLILSAEQEAERMPGVFGNKKTSVRILIGVFIGVIAVSMLLYLVPQGSDSRGASSDTIATIGDESV